MHKVIARCLVILGSGIFSPVPLVTMLGFPQGRFLVAVGLCCHGICHGPIFFIYGCGLVFF